MSRSFDSKEFTGLFEKNREARKIHHDAILAFRLEIQEKITDEEWAIIMAAVANPKSKVIKKKDKAQLKAQIKRDKRIVAAENEIKTAFEDSEKVEQVVALLDQWETNMANLLFRTQEEGAILADVMQNRSASKQDLQDMVDEYEDFRSGAHKSFIELRSALIELSSEDQWKKISKAKNKLF